MRRASGATTSTSPPNFRTLNAFHLPEKRGDGTSKILVDGPDAVVLGEDSLTVAQAFTG